MAETKWDKLPYLLETPQGIRSLIILSNFEPLGEGWFDTGKYTIAENAHILGDISVDLYTDDGISWNGRPNEFTDEELNKIVSYATFPNLDGDIEPF